MTQWESSDFAGMRSSIETALGLAAQPHPLVGATDDLRSRPSGTPNSRRPPGHVPASLGAPVLPARAEVRATPAPRRYH